MEDMKFSEGFNQDIGKLLDLCVKNHTNSCDVKLELKHGTLAIEMTFTAIPSESEVAEC